MSHPADTSRTASRWVADHPGDLPPGEGDLFRVNADTEARRLTPRADPCLLAGAFVPANVRKWRSLACRSLRVCSVSHGCR